MKNQSLGAGTSFLERPLKEHVLLKALKICAYDSGICPIVRTQLIVSEHFI